MDGNGGDDIVLLEDGDDSFVWNHGDGNDFLDAGDGTGDKLAFNGSSSVEAIFAGEQRERRLLVTRDLGNVTSTDSPWSRSRSTRSGAPTTSRSENLAAAGVTIRPGRSRRRGGRRRRRRTP